MKIVRFCGKERLPGGARLWQRLARRATFDGTLLVFGYGVGGEPGQQQRRAYRRSETGGYTHGDWRIGSGPESIRVWLPCVCQTVDFDPDLDLNEGDTPIEVFAHELGHAIQHRKGRMYADADRDEAVATRYGRLLLRAVR